VAAVPVMVSLPADVGPAVRAHLAPVHNVTVDDTVLQERFSAALHSSARAWRLALDRRLRRLGLSQASWMTITMVARSSSPLSQAELAQRVGVEAATMAVMVSRLSHADLVTRRQSVSDRRVKLVYLTPAGDALFSEVLVEAAVMRKALLGVLDPHRLAHATELLEQILVLLDQPA
jgi:MarR family transcriptional regulator for hemolysin